jgi:branched-chain amino acid transport system permease protein
MTAASGYGADPRIRLVEWLPWVLGLAVYFFLPEYLLLGARVLTYILILGYGGIITLGHAAFFGIGAYTAGLLSARLGWADPFLLLVAAVFAAGAFGIATGAVILRTRGLTQLMLTLAVAALCLEFAQKATTLTGGTDGLTGVTITPIFGLFDFDLFGKTAYLWCLTLLFASWWMTRRIVYSPFGATLCGIRENKVRMHSIGVPVYRRLLTAYTISAMIAGLAGALLAQTNEFVGLNVLSFDLSGELLVMLILGGVGRLYGAFVGPLVYLVAQDFLAKQFPEYWYFGIGLMLVLVVLFARGGILGLADALVLRSVKLK